MKQYAIWSYLLQVAWPSGRKPASWNGANATRCCQCLVDGFTRCLCRKKAFHNG